MATIDSFYCTYYQELPNWYNHGIAHTLHIHVNLKLMHFVLTIYRKAIQISNRLVIPTPGYTTPTTPPPHLLIEQLRVLLHIICQSVVWVPTTNTSWSSSGSSFPAANDVTCCPMLSRVMSESEDETERRAVDMVEGEGLDIRW